MRQFVRSARAILSIMLNQKFQIDRSNWSVKKWIHWKRTLINDTLFKLLVYKFSVSSFLITRNSELFF